jgi:PKD repeat protein
MNGFAAYPGGQDSLGIVTNSIYDPTANSGWEQWDNATWYDMNSAWGVDVSQYIRAILCGGCASSLIINPSTTNPTCNQSNGSINITASGGTAPYQFSIDGGATYQASGSFTNLAAGTYNVIIEDVTGCFETNTITLSNLGGVTPTITSNQSICSGNSVSITAGGAGAGGSYMWDNGLGSGSSHVISPASTTTYTVTIIDVNGCTSTASVTISVDIPPTVSVNPSSGSVCSGESITITASGAQSYSWNTGANTSSITVTPTNQTTYTVIGQNGSCAGSAVSATINVTQSPVVTASANSTTIAIGGTVSFSSAGSGATSYVWDFGDGNTSTQNNPSHTYTTSGVFTVTLTGTLNGCVNTFQLTINVGNVDVLDYDLENAIHIVPNPNEGQFEVLISIPETQDLEITLYNSIGQMIKSDLFREVNKNNFTYDLSNHPGGIYLLNVKTNRGTTTKRLLILD